jgi:septation ring formation regulator EzrA
MHGCLMLLITNKQVLAILKNLSDRINHLDEGMKHLRDEIRRVHVLQTCGGESTHIKQLIERLDKIEEHLSKVLIVKKVRKKGNDST